MRSGTPVQLRRDGSSSSTTSDPREQVKDCCRKLVAFLFTQVGVGALLVGYAIVGALAFMYIESGWTNFQNAVVESLSEQCVGDLWNITNTYQSLDIAAMRREYDSLILNYQRDVTKAIRDGYAGKAYSDLWTFHNALMYCLGIFTMNGYSNLVPQTALGKCLTMAYAVFGIPLYVLYLMNIGKVFASTFIWLYKKWHENANGDLLPHNTVPFKACFLILGGYVFLGTVMFAEWEDWNYLDSAYFCVTSLCKIGFGNLVPGANTFNSGSQTRLVASFVYMLLGTGLIAMCFKLMSDKILEKLRVIKDRIRLWLEDTHLRAVAALRVINTDTALNQNVRFAVRELE